MAARTLRNRESQNNQFQIAVSFYTRKITMSSKKNLNLKKQFFHFIINLVCHPKMTFLKKELAASFLTIQKMEHIQGRTNFPY